MTVHEIKKPETVRLTIPVTAEVHEVFTAIAASFGIGTGRAMGNWLEDTLDAAELMSRKLEEARKAPRVVAQEMQALSLGLAEETEALVVRLREKAKEDRARKRRANSEGSQQSPGGAGPGTTDPFTPRVVIRGVKSSRQGK